MDLFSHTSTPLVRKSQTALHAARVGAFTDNMKLPVHRWFRYSAGFSAQWIESIIEERSTDRTLDVLDPFCGSGTTLLAAAAQGANSVGFETHPFVNRIARSKTQRSFSVSEFSSRARKILERSRQQEQESPKSSSELLRKCYSDQALARLESIRSAYETLSLNDQVDDLLWLAITSILRECSGVGTAQWQYLLPNRSKAKVVDPFQAFFNKCCVMESDLCESQFSRDVSISVLNTDARKGFVAQIG